jgi:hypothetical protein
MEEELLYYIFLGYSILILTEKITLLSEKGYLQGG